MINTLISGILQTAPRLMQSSKQIFASVPTLSNNWNFTSVRTIRYHFPSPNERKRIKMFSWNARMATHSGRKILMRRILKGRYVLSH